MAETNISWCDYTFNPWIGCAPVSPACNNCYARRDFGRKPRWANCWTADGDRLRTSDAYWKKPLAWNKKCEAQGVRASVFCGSLCDVFESDHKLDQWRYELGQLIFSTPSLDWLLLTKRPQNYSDAHAHLHDALRGAWIGITAENQAMADLRIHQLLEIPAKGRFVSIEPMLGPVDFSSIRHGNDPDLPVWDQHIHAVIVGGESGPNARPMYPDWVRSVRDQCKAANVPFHFKQWGEWLSGCFFTDELMAMDEQNPEIGSRFPCMDWDEDGNPFETESSWMDDLSEHAVYRVGRKFAGRLLDGVFHNGPLPWAVGQVHG